MRTSSTQDRSTPEQAVGKSILLPPQEDGTRHRAKILSIIKEYIQFVSSVVQKQFHGQVPLGDGGVAVVAPCEVVGFNSL